MFGDRVAAQYRVLIERDEDGVFVAEVPSLPGCVSQGHTRDQALANIKDAIAGYLASLRERGEEIPPGLSEEVVEVK
jgi:predicted RNase H-like HicB family nuclease